MLDRKICPKYKAALLTVFPAVYQRDIVCDEEQCALWESSNKMCSLAVPGHLAALQQNIEEIRAERAAFKSDRM